jgi:hypothetical protein
MIEHTKDLELVPVHITGPVGSHIIPVFSGIDDFERRGSFVGEEGLRSLSLALDTSPGSMRDWIAGFSGKESQTLRILADELRLCGVLGVKSSATDAFQPILPSTGCYAHGESHSDNLDEPLEMGKLGNADVLLFAPFKSLPSSCLVERFERSLYMTSRSDTIPTPAYDVRWEQRGPVSGSQLLIAGWTRSSNVVQDVVAIPAFSGYRGCQLLLGPEGNVVGVRSTNAIVRVGDEGSGWNPDVTPLHGMSILSRTRSNG